MSLGDIDSLSSSPTPGQAGHREDHGKIARGLKALKAESISSAEGTPSNDKVLSYNDGELVWQKTGEVAYAASSVLFSTDSGSPVNLPGMEVTFATEDRPVNLTLSIPLAYSNVDAIGVIEIYDGTNVIASTPLVIRSKFGTVTLRVRIEAGTASKTYTGRFWKFEGSDYFEITPALPFSQRSLQAVTI